MDIGIVTAPKAVLYELSYEEGNDDDISFIADEVLSGWAVGVLERRGQLLKVVTHYGYEGLLKKEMLIPSTVQEIRLREEGQEGYLVIAGRADLMSIPSIKGIVIETLYAGSIVIRKEAIAENGYCRVYTAAGNCGYLPLIAVAMRRDSDAYLYSEEPQNYFLNQAMLTDVKEEAFRNEVAECARRYLGTQYRWGGKTVDGIDCSGMTFMSYMLCGVLIYRDAQLLNSFPLKEIPISKIGKGDLIFFPGHVAMYLGNNQYIHSTAYKDNFCCVINSLSSSDDNYREDLAAKVEAVGTLFY